MKSGLSDRSYGASSSQGVERFIEVDGARQLPDCELALLYVQKINGDAPGPEITEKRVFTSFTARVF